MLNYMFEVPENKKLRLIVHTDCKNEADDQFALAHHLMTPKFIVKGIVAGHFEKNPQEYGSGNTALASYDEIVKVLNLMGMAEEYPIALGAGLPLADTETPNPSAGTDMIIAEAMRDDPLPLFAVFQGSLTDLASAILKQPEICDRMTAVWIGGGVWPEGGFEFNLMQDIHAANVVFGSAMPVWQVPQDVYKQVAVTLAELQLRVRPCGELGRYLFKQMVDFNTKYAHVQHWPHGESWGLGDQGTISVLLEEGERANWRLEEAPLFAEDMKYIHGKTGKKIRVYHTLDSRMTMEDFYAKLEINYGSAGLNKR